MSITLLALRLRELREKHNFTQAYIGNYLNVSRSAYGNYELGKRTPDYSTLLKLCQLYQIPISALISNELTPFSETADDSEYDAVKENAIFSEGFQHLARLIINSRPKIDLAALTQKDINFLCSFKQLDSDSQEDIILFTKIKGRKKN